MYTQKKKKSINIYINIFILQYFFHFLVKRIYNINIIKIIGHNTVVIKGVIL